MTPSSADTRSSPPRGAGGRFAFVIPVYNHGATVEAVICSARRLGLPVVVVDDGSTDATGSIVGAIPGIHLLRHPVNRGKGAALISGMAAAADFADWAISVDADGQHDPADAAAMIRAILPGTRPIVVGMRRRMSVGDAPWSSRIGRSFSNLWVRCAGGPAVSDSQSGFRIYPLPEALHLGATAQRFQFEVEILVKAGWHCLPVMETDVGVCYRPASGRVSHFRPFIDSVRNAGVFSRLITRRILRRRPPSRGNRQGYS